MHRSRHIIVSRHHKASRESVRLTSTTLRHDLSMTMIALLLRFKFREIPGFYLMSRYFRLSLSSDYKQSHWYMNPLVYMSKRISNEPYVPQWHFHDAENRMILALYGKYRHLFILFRFYSFVSKSFFPPTLLSWFVITSFIVIIRLPHIHRWCLLSFHSCLLFLPHLVTSSDGEQCSIRMFLLIFQFFLLEDKTFSIRIFQTGK